MPSLNYLNNADNDLTNSCNTRYTINVTVAGTVVNAFVDTGSTDLWLNPPGGVIGAFNSTGVAAKLDFGDGTYFVNGTIGLAKVAIAGQKVPAQAFLNVTENIGFTGEYGIVGLSFDVPGFARIPAALTAAKLDGAVVGKSFLSSVFDQNPDKGRFFALSLSRLFDPKDSADAGLDIAELDEKYTAVQAAPVLPQYPSDSIQWSILSDGIQVNGAPITWPSNTESTPEGKNVVLLNSGTSNILVPAEIRDAIYSNVPGAVLAKSSRIPNSQWSSDRDVWVVPCSTPIRMSTFFGGQRIRIHPLDVVDLTTAVGPDGQNYTICVGAITNGDVLSAGSLDANFGDTFLRNTYTVFNFGNETTKPHVQLLSVTPRGAANDFKRVRAKALRNGPPELAPADIIALFDAASTSGSSGADGKLSNNLAAAASTASNNTDSQVSKYAPIVIGLLGANLVLLVVLVAFGVVWFIRGGRRVGSVTARQYAPVKLREDMLRADREEGRYSDGPH
ncbi:aspartic peptidase domain-containing protein [Mycena polygramma]|nr:aspartic peptidase domain-containing protein [Mycena polygramma]